MHARALVGEKVRSAHGTAAEVNAKVEKIADCRLRHNRTADSLCTHFDLFRMRILNLDYDCVCILFLVV